MPLIVTGSIGIDTVHTPTATAERVLGGSAAYFAASAALFSPDPVRLVAAVGDDFPDSHRAVLEGLSNVNTDGLEVRPGSSTFSWGGKYHTDWNVRDTLFTELGVLGEAPSPVPASYKGSRYVFLANAHPAVQADLFSHFPSPRLSVVDTMDLWINTARDSLLGLLRLVDGVVLNDQEASQLTEITNPIAAGRAILDLGPTFVVVKKGEHGCVLVHQDGLAALPAYPTDSVVDPTGAGDSFAGGMMGHIARTDASHAAGVSFQTVQAGLAYGTVAASFTIESFSLDRLTSLSRNELDERLQDFSKMVRIDTAQV